MLGVVHPERSLEIEGEESAAAGSSSEESPWRILAGIRGILRLFFRRIEVVGAENVPVDRGGVLVSWHPNGLLDPALILAHCPRRVVFGARHGLFTWPLLGRLMRHLGTVPVYRPQDFPGESGDEARREANRRSLDRLAAAVAGGSYAALFPEGVSHDEPRLRVLRPGAARLFLRAVELGGEDAPPPVIVPVGLHYDRKHLFGSVALVEFHPPMEIPDELARPASSPEERRDQVGELTSLLRAVLTEIIQATESWDLHGLMHRLRKLLRAERAARVEAAPGPSSMRERVLGFARVRRAYQVRQETHPDDTERLRKRIRDYDRELDSLGLDDHDLDETADATSPWRGLSLLAQVVVIYLLLPPLLVLGYVVNLPVAFGLGVAARRMAAERKDEATLKLLLGLVVFPLVWLTISLLVAWGQINLHDAYPTIPRAPWLAGIVTFLLCSVGGWIGLRYLRIASELYHTLRVRFTRRFRRDAVERLRRERAGIAEEVLGLAEGLDLPGVVDADGRIRASSS